MASFSSVVLSVAGWSSPVARQAHNLKVVGSNPTPATKLSIEPLTLTLIYHSDSVDLRLPKFEVKRDDRRTAKKNLPALIYPVAKAQFFQSIRKRLMKDTQWHS